MIRLDKKNKAFLLIDLLISITIIAIMISSISFFLLGNEKEARLSSFQNLLIAEMRYVQANSMNKIAIYGMHLSSNHAVLFIDENNSKIFETGTDTIIKEIKIPKDVTILPDPSNIIFKKDGTADMPGRKIIIVLGLSGAENRQILINRIGLIKKIN